MIPSMAQTEWNHTSQQLSSPNRPASRTECGSSDGRSFVPVASGSPALMSNWKALWPWGCWAEQGGPLPVMTGVSVWVPISPNVKSKTNGLSYAPPRSPCTHVALQSLPRWGEHMQRTQVTKASLTGASKHVQSSQLRLKVFLTLQLLSHNNLRTTGKQMRNDNFFSSPSSFRRCKGISRFAHKLQC